LVGIFRAIVYVSVLPVLHTLEHLPLRGAIAVQLVGDHHPWDVLASVEALPAELLGCRLIPSALPQDLAHVTVLLHRPPQLMALPIDRPKDLIEMPRVAWSRAATAHLVGIRLPKLPAPRADRSYDTSTPGANSSSSTSRSLRQNRSYSQTPWLMRSTGER
jgi:hypothetical protein